MLFRNRRFRFACREWYTELPLASAPLYGPRAGLTRGLVAMPNGASVAKTGLPFRTRGRSRWILVALVEKMHAPRTDVSDGHDRGIHDLPLNIEIPLHLIRRGPRIVVYCVAL